MVLGAQHHKGIQREQGTTTLVLVICTNHKKRLNKTSGKRRNVVKKETSGKCRNVVQKETSYLSRKRRRHWHHDITTSSTIYWPVDANQDRISYIPKHRTNRKENEMKQEFCKTTQASSPNDSDIYLQNKSSSIIKMIKFFFKPNGNEPFCRPPRLKQRSLYNLQQQLLSFPRNDLQQNNLRQDCSNQTTPNWVQQIELNQFVYKECAETNQFRCVKLERKRNLPKKRASRTSPYVGRYCVCTILSNRNGSRNEYDNNTGITNAESIWFWTLHL